MVRLHRRRDRTGMQPRSDLRQRCMTFSLDVAPHANVMMYRDFFGNAVHHFDIPGRHKLIEVTAHAIVDVNPAAFPAVEWRLARPMGRHRLIREIVLDRAREVDG